MEKISYKDFLNFLASDLNEFEYFNCDKTSLISLKDYLTELKEKKESYDKLITEPLKSIQSKNKWVKHIEPDHFLNKDGLVVLGKTAPTFLLGIEPKYANVEDYIRIGGYYVTPFLELKMKIRKKLLENSQEELHEINKIVHQLNVIEKPFTTISNRFEINPSDYDKCDIECFGWPIIRYIRDTEKLEGVKPAMSSETFYKKEGIYPSPLTSEEREKLVKKLYIKKTF